LIPDRDRPFDDLAERQDAELVDIISNVRHYLLLSFCADPTTAFSFSTIFRVCSFQV
jgi:hypothetical protein